MKNFCVVVILISLFGKGHSFPNSAPTTACGDLTPGHTFTTQILTNPYRIDVNQREYTNNGQVQGKNKCNLKSFYP